MIGLTKTFYKIRWLDFLEMRSLTNSIETIVIGLLVSVISLEMRTSTISIETIGIGLLVSVLRARVFPNLYHTNNKLSLTYGKTLFSAHE